VSDQRPGWWPGGWKWPPNLTVFVPVAVVVVVVASFLWLDGGGDGDVASTGTTTGGHTTEATEPRPPTSELIRLPVDVAPDTKLRDGDTVTVSGSGFLAGETVFVALCATPEPGGALDAARCDDSTENRTGADGSGAFETTFDVASTITTGDGEVDCRRARGVCAIGVRSDGDRARTGWATLAFDESVLPPPEARITVEPSTGLVDGMTVTVTGRFFARNDDIELRQCPPDDTGLCWSVDGGGVTTDDDGAFEVGVPVWRLLDGDAGQPVDCAAIARACQLQGIGVHSGGQPPAAPLEFDPDGPLPAVPMVTLDPSGPITDGQEVLVSGAGFVPGQGVLVELCTLDESGLPDSCLISDVTGFEPVDVRADGTWSRPVTIPRNLGFDSGVDCRERAGACGVLADVVYFSNASIQHAPLTPAPAPLTFD
jgi:hypothetical protein